MYAFLQAELFKKEEEKKQEAMANLAQQNSALKNTDPCFMFEGIWYVHPYGIIMPDNKKGFNRILDNSLKDEAYNIMHKKDFTFIRTKAIITDYFGKALQVCNTLKCLNKVLPPSLKIDRKFDMVGLVYDIGEPLSNQEIEIFKENNKAGRAVLNTLFLTELIMSKVGE